MESRKEANIAYIKYLLQANNLASIPNLECASKQELDNLFVNLSRMSSHSQRMIAYSEAKEASVRYQIEQVLN